MRQLQMLYDLGCECGSKTLIYFTTRPPPTIRRRALSPSPPIQAPLMKQASKLKRDMSDGDCSVDSSFEGEFPMASFEDDVFARSERSESQSRVSVIREWLCGRSKQRVTRKPASSSRIICLFTLAVLLCYFAGMFARDFFSGCYVAWSDSITNLAGHKALVRGLRLSNGLNVLLWSDAQMDKAGCAIAFDAGSWSDPSEHAGVAHFLEHMVFMGSTRYPEQDVLFAFLAQHGGSGNAYTAPETTNYFLEVDPPFLLHATSIMADSVIAPLLSEAAAVAEINAVNAEHAKNRARDGWRIDMLGRSFAIPHHELTRFGTGNEETLRSSLPALRAFHTKHYIATRAAVAVVGPSPLDDLEAVALAAFGHMPKQADSPSTDDIGEGDAVSTSTGATRKLQPYLFAGESHSSGLQVLLIDCIMSLKSIQQAKHAGRFTLAAAFVGLCPQFRTRVLHITQIMKRSAWCESHSLLLHRSSLLLTYILPPLGPREEHLSSVLSNFLGYEGVGSLSAWLRSNEFADGLSVGVSSPDSTGAVYSTLEMSVQLTKLGSQSIGTILPAIASWVRVSVAPESRDSFMKFWNTARRLALLSSNFPSIPRASELPQQLASNLLRVGHRDSVSLQWTWQTPASRRLDDVFRNIHFGRCLIMLNLPTNSPPVNFDGTTISEQGGLPSGFINGTERWYGTPYLATGISVENLKILENSAAHMDNVWKLPANNRFLPDDVLLVSGNSDPKPSLVHSAETSGAFPSRSQVWHALDNSFGSPKQFTHLETFCPSPPAASALSSVTAAVMSKLIVNNLLPQFYDAGLAGLSVGLSPSLSGWQFRVGGWSSMSLPLFSSFFSALNVFTDSSSTAAYKAGHDSIVRAVQEVRLDLEKSQRSSAHQLASSLLSDALTRHAWSIQEQLAVIDNPECPASSRGSEACVHAAFQSSMLQHMDNCFGFNLGSKPAPAISVRSLSVGSVSAVTAGDFSRAFISGYSKGSARFLNVPPQESEGLLPHEIKQGWGKVPDGHWILADSQANIHDENTAVNVYYQMPFSTTYNKVLLLQHTAELAVFSAIARQKCFETLRTVQQLGYIATCGARRFLSSLGFFALVQSSDYIAPVIDVRIRDFLATFPGIIRSTPAPVFENFRSGAASDVAEADKNVEERSDRWWHELSTNRRSWNRPHELAAAIRKVSQTQVLAFAELLAFNASSVSSWVVPASVNPASFASASPIAKYLGEPSKLRQMILTHYED